MAESTGAISAQIRKIIFTKYNDPEEKFTNDELFAELQKEGTVDKSAIIDDMEPHFAQLCDAGLMRNIAQNFTTQWFKLFEPLQEAKCASCGKLNHTAKSEEQKCLYCGASMQT